MMKCDLCDAEMFRVPRSPKNDEDVVDPYWMCSKCENVQLVVYSALLCRDGKTVSFVLLDKKSWNKVGPLLAEHFNLFPIGEEKLEAEG